MNKETKKEKELASEAATALGSLGGKATVKNKGKRYMKRLGKEGSDARWGKTGK